MLAVSSLVVERHMEECWMASVILSSTQMLKQRFELPARAEKLAEKVCSTVGCKGQYIFKIVLQI